VDNVLGYIEKYRFAIIGTVMIHVAFFFYANFATVTKPYKLVPPEVVISIPLDDIDFDPELMEQLALTNPQESEEVFNVAADANDSRERSYEDYSTQEMETFDMTNAKDLEAQYMAEWAATHPDEKASADITDKNNDKNDDRNPTDKSIDDKGSNAFAGAVMVSYDLESRKAHSLPKPGYTCNSAGTVVIDVKVDKSGSVKTATFNSSLSRSADECMISSALRYAKKSRFNMSSSSSSQAGTITYKFVSK
jgi:hypothetical protein